METTKAYKLIGTTDEVTECGCCGKTGLKGTVVLLDTVTDNYVWFGSQCGARALGWTVQAFDAEAQAAQIAREFAAELERLGPAPITERGNQRRATWRVIAQGMRGARKGEHTIHALTIEELIEGVRRSTGYITRKTTPVIHSIKAIGY